MVTVFLGYEVLGVCVCLCVFVCVCVCVCIKSKDNVLCKCHSICSM